MAFKKIRNDEQGDLLTADAENVSDIVEDEGEDGLTDITCRIDDIIYQSGSPGEAGYAVYSVREPGDKKFKLVTRALIDIAPGDMIDARGYWTTHHKFGKQFDAVAMVHGIAPGAKGIERWMVKEGIPGVGKGTAKKLAQHFGNDLKTVIKDPLELAKAGIKPELAEAISDTWNASPERLEVAALLHRFDLSANVVARAVSRLWSQANLLDMSIHDLLKENPWALTEVDGIGFKTADQIAQAQHKDTHDPGRIRAGISHIIKEAQGNGHCGLPRERIEQKARRLLRVNRGIIGEHLDEVEEETGLLAASIEYDPEVELFYTVPTRTAEINVAYRLIELVETGNALDSDTAEDLVEKALKRPDAKPLDDTQHAAVMRSLTNGVSVITGGPGTGKSTSLKTVVEALRKIFSAQDIALAAPTGRAAKRMHEAIGMPAETIHRLLQFNPAEGGFMKDQHDPLQQKWIVVDEFSMVDIRLCSSLLRAVRNGASLIIVGDVDQLPSVGPGQVLRDLIESDTIPVSRLTTVHRTADDSGIPIAAQRVNNGIHPLAEGEYLEGFEVRDFGNSARRATDEIVRLITEELPAQGIDPFRDVQVLTAKRDGDSGLHTLNKKIKEALNPAREDDHRSIKLGGRDFTIGDRIMHIRNDYKKYVFNGEVGTVVFAGEEPDDDGNIRKLIKVEYEGRPVSYTAPDVIDIEQAWCATIHKSQGCEFPIVLMAVTPEQNNMLLRNLVYTGITRAKDRCVIVGSDKSFTEAINRSEIAMRYTGLLWRLNPDAPERSYKPIPAMTSPQPSGNPFAI